MRVKELAMILKGFDPETDVVLGVEEGDADTKYYNICIAEHWAEGQPDADFCVLYSGEVISN